LGFDRKKEAFRLARPAWTERIAETETGRVAEGGGWRIQPSVEKGPAMEGAEGTLWKEHVASIGRHREGGGGGVQDRNVLSSPSREKKRTDKLIGRRKFVGGDKNYPLPLKGG